jgi:hypothetical protein
MATSREAKHNLKSYHDATVTGFHRIPCVEV